MYQVLIDGDNVSIEKYFEHVIDNIRSITKEEKCDTTILCQSNLFFRFCSNRSFDVSIKCCKTQNKNATDANILFLAGKYIAQGFNIIIVSNDKIYSEISDNNNVIIIGYNPPETPYSFNKLRKKTIVRFIKQLKESHPPNYDVTLDDLHYFFPKISLFELRKYIASLSAHGIILNNTDNIYLNFE